MLSEPTTLVSGRRLKVRGLGPGSLKKAPQGRLFYYLCVFLHAFDDTIVGFRRLRDVWREMSDATR